MDRKNVLDNPDKMLEYGSMKPLPIPIPYDLAEVLEISPSNICHINAGRRQLSVDKSIQLMAISLTDDRLTGLAYYHLRSEQKPAHPYVCLGCPHKAKAKKGRGR